MTTNSVTFKFPRYVKPDRKTLGKRYLKAILRTLALEELRHEKHSDKFCRNVMGEVYIRPSRRRLLKKLDRYDDRARYGK